MTNSRVLKTILFVSGLIATVVGGAILVMPVGFYALNGIEFTSDINLLNEIRAPGGALLASGILIMSGAFVAKLTFTATVLSIVLFLSYGLSRILSIAIDGMPVEGLVQAAVLEIVIGMACVLALVAYRENDGRIGGVKDD